MSSKARKQNQISSIEIENGVEKTINQTARARWRKAAKILDVVNHLKLYKKFPSTNVARERSKKLEDILTGTFSGKMSLSNSPTDSLESF